MNNRCVVLIGGKKGSGKNTFASMLEEEGLKRGYQVRQAAFADELRDHLSVLNPIVGQWGHYGTDLIRWNEAIGQFGYHDAKAKFPEMRRIMQIYGTEIVRDRIDGVYWDRKLRENMDPWLQKNGKRLLLVTDCRFESEVEMFDFHEEFLQCSAGEDPSKLEMLRYTDVYLIQIDRGDLQNVEDSHRSENGIDVTKISGNIKTMTVLNDWGLVELANQATFIANKILGLNYSE